MGDDPERGSTQLSSSPVEYHVGAMARGELEHPPGPAGLGVVDRLATCVPDRRQLALAARGADDPAAVGRWA
jgi:hypothetical protein